MENEDKIEELLTRGVEEVINREDLKQKLLGKKKLRVKLGIDPTSPNIHIGRAGALWKLRAFQELGHTAIFIVGDFTGMIGDSSDKESERPMLSEKEVKANGKSYFEQAYKILDKKKTEVYYNSKWLKKLGFLELAKMSNLFGLHQFASREVIARRMKADQRVSYLELMYPLMQGYDSVAVKADVEIGGTDQRFNLLTGRDIQKFYKQSPQDIMMLQLLEGVDGRKMSSSWGNVINLTDEPNDMFGKVMSIHDNLIKKYFILATRVPLKKVEEIILVNANPRDQKLALAKEIVALYYGMEKAELAKQAFVNQFSKGELPNVIEIKEIASTSMPLSGTLLFTGMTASKSEARRLVKQGGVKIDGKVVNADIEIEFTDEPKLIQVGKRKFVKVKRKK